MLYIFDRWSRCASTRVLLSFIARKKKKKKVVRKYEWAREILKWGPQHFEFPEDLGASRCMRMCRIRQAPRVSQNIGGLLFENSNDACISQAVDPDRSVFFFFPLTYFCTRNIRSVEINRWFATCSLTLENISGTLVDQSASQEVRPPWWPKVGYTALFSHEKNSGSRGCRRLRGVW